MIPEAPSLVCVHGLVGMAPGCTTLMNHFYPLMVMRLLLFGRSTVYCKFLLFFHYEKHMFPFLEEAIFCLSFLLRANQIGS